MLRYAIVGTGSLSARYRSAIAETGGVLTAVCSRSRSRAEEFGGPRVAAYDDLSALLRDENVDAVYLCLPNRFHADAAEQCLLAGKHVLCEKPATTSVDELLRVLQASERAGRIFAEGVMNFHSPAMQRLRQELQENPISSARLDYSQRSSKLDSIRSGATASAFDRSLCGGVLNDLGVYPLHFAVGLFGEPEGIDASARFLNEVDVSAALTLHYGEFDAVVTVSKTGQSCLGSEILCDRATYTLKNVSVVLGAEKHSAAGTEAIDCGFPDAPWPVSDPSRLPGVQARVLRAFSRWTAGEDQSRYLQLLRETISVQWLLDEAHRLIGY